MITLRDFIITIVAIFLALALGIMVGISLSDSLVLENQRQVIETLETRLNDRRQEMAEMQLREQDYQNRKEQWQEFAGSLLPYLTRDGLQGKQVGLLCVDEEGFQTAIQPVLAAGGEISRVVEIDPGGDGSVLEVYSGSEQVSFWVAAYLRGEEPGPLPPGNLVNFRGSGGTDLVLVEGEGWGKSINRVMAVLKELREQGILVIGTGPGSKDSELLSIMEAEGFATVSHIDTAFGILSLLEVAARGQGNYGPGKRWFPEKWTYLEE